MCGYVQTCVHIGCTHVGMCVPVCAVTRTFTLGGWVAYAWQVAAGLRDLGEAERRGNCGQGRGNGDSCSDISERSEEPWGRGAF